MYGELKKGDKVVLVGERYDKYSGVRFEFLTHARNMRTNDEWLELYGGKRGYEHIFAVDIKAVRRLT